MTDTLTQGPEITGEDVKADQRDDRTDKVLDQADQAPVPEAPAEMTTADKTDIATMNAAPEAVEPANPANPVSNANVLDLRDQNAQVAADRQRDRINTLQSMADAGEPVVTAGALDRQAAPATEAPVEAPATTTEPAPEAKKPGFFKRLFGGKA